MKRIAVLGILVAMVISSGSVLAASSKEIVSNDNSSMVSTVNSGEKVKSVKDVTNWEKGAMADIVETGTGLQGQFTGAQARLMARRAAIVDCYRNLVARVQGVLVDSDTTVENLMVSSDIVKNKISGLVKGAKIIAEGEMADGSYYVKMSLPVYGSNSIASAVIPEIMRDVVEPEAPEKVTRKHSVLSKKEFKEAKQVTYTGVVVDVSGLGLECTMAPQIMDTNGRVIYGKENINIDMAVSRGLAEYSKNLHDATNGSTRAGINPLVVKAFGVKAGTNSVNPVNVVVTPEDADRILLAAQNNSNIMKNGDVVFVR